MAEPVVHSGENDAVSERLDYNEIMAYNNISELKTIPTDRKPIF